MNATNMLMTEQEAADMLQISLATMRRMRQDGSGPPFLQFGVRRGIRYSADGLLDWIRRNEEGGAQ
jgi:hypothetical protein